MSIAVFRIADNASLWEIGREQGVQRMRYLTHPELVKQVCPECLFYHDTVWEIDNALAPEPPLHPMCACTMEPEFEPGTVLGDNPDGDPMVTEPAPELKPGEHLARLVNGMTAKQQDKFLGPLRGRLLRSDLIETEQLVRRKSGVRTLDSLLQSAGVTRKELETLNYEQLQSLAERRLRARRRAGTVKTRRRRSTQPGELGVGYLVSR